MPGDQVVTKQLVVRPAPRTWGRTDVLSRLAAPAVVAACAAVATTLVAVVDPGVPGRYPVCPILAVTGYSCPGCGGLRAVHALAHGDLGAAADHNVLVVAVLPVVVVGYGLWARRRLAGRPVRTGSSVAPVAAVVTAVVMLVFAVLRNLPAFAVLAP